MNKIVAVAGLIAAFGLCASPALAQPETRPATTLASAPATTPATKPATARADLGAYADMVRVCDLSAGQQEQLADKVQKMRESLSEFWRNNQGKMTQLRKALAEAQENKDARKVQDLQAQLRQILEEDYKKIRLQHEKDIHSILQPAQRVRWEALSVDRILARYTRLELTDEQKKKIEQIRDAGAQELAAIAQPGDLEAQSQIYRKIQKQVYDELLTDAQRQQVPAPASAPASSPVTSRDAQASGAVAVVVVSPKRQRGSR